MKYAFMTFSTPELSLQDALDTAKRYGYDAIEPRLDAKHAHGVEVAASAEERAAIRKTVEQAGVPLACLATSCVYADPARTGEMIQSTLERIDLAADVGAPRLRVFGGKLGEGLSREEAIDLVANTLAKVSARAAERGVTLCVETHDDWCDPQHVAAVMQNVDHPNIRVNWDFMHPTRTGHATVEQSFETLKPWIAHVHFHDGVQSEGKLEMVPIGEGQIDHKKALDAIQELPYDGVFSGEWINWQPWEQHLPRELATMKRYEKELGIG